MSSAASAEARSGRFRPGRALTAAWAACTVLLLALGGWQVQRLAWKSALIERAGRELAAPPRALPDGPLDPAELDFVRLRVSGVYLPGTSLALGLLSRNGQAGARLLTALRLADGRTLLVDRGFVPEAELARAIGTPPPGGLRELEGVARAVRSGSWAAPRPDLALPRWYAADLEAIGRHLGAVLEPVLFVLEKAEEGEGPYPAPAPVSLDLPNPHLGYALTWFGLAAALQVFYILLGRRPLGEKPS